MGVGVGVGVLCLLLRTSSVGLKYFLVILSSYAPITQLRNVRNDNCTFFK